MITILLLFIILFTSAPIFVAIGGTALISTTLFSNIPSIMIPQRMLYSIDSITLMAGPFFALSGMIITRGKLASKLVEFFKALFSPVPGGLAVASVMSCAAFGAITGSAVAALMAIGSIMIPALVKAGYEEGFSASLLTTASTLAVLIPPSVPMIVYCAVADLSVARLFASGIVPGIFISMLLSSYVIFYAIRRRFPTESFSFQGFLKTFKGCIWAISFPIVVLGTIYTGICTPTESSAIAVFYSFFIEYFIYKSFSIKELKGILIDTSMLVGAIFIIISVASVLASYWTLEQIPEMIAQRVTELIQQRWLFLIVVNLLLIIAGCLLDEISAILILVPLLSVLIGKFEIDPYHFAIIFVVNMNIGFVTPPVGLCLTTAAILTNIPIMKIVKAAIPVLLVLLLGLCVITFWESLTLLPVNLLMGTG
jgi:C4-dicarboxylate transporter DctM subunit